MAYVTGVDHERRFCRQSADLVDRLLERAYHIRIGRLVEADMAVANLHEGKPPSFLPERLPDKAERFWDAAFDRPEDAGSSPDHAFEDGAAPQALLRVISNHNQSPVSI
jgi:hypothetical protein